MWPTWTSIHQTSSSWETSMSLWASRTPSTRRMVKRRRRKRLQRRHLEAITLVPRTRSLYTSVISVSLVASIRRSSQTTRLVPYTSCLQRGYVVRWATWPTSRCRSLTSGQLECSSSSLSLASLHSMAVRQWRSSSLSRRHRSGSRITSGTMSWESSFPWCKRCSRLTSIVGLIF